MTVTYPETPTSRVEEPETKKSGPTKATVSALFREFEPQAAPEVTPAEKERIKRLGQLNAQIQRLAVDLRNLGIEDAKDLVSAERAVKALASLSKSARVAIESIPDSKLVPAEKAPAKPRATSARTLSPEDASAAVERASTETVGETETQEDEAPHEEQAVSTGEATTVAPAVGRSGPPAAAAPRGDEDPNAGDGF